LKIKDDVVGREVLDGNGHKIGKVEDVDVDFDSNSVSAIIVEEGGLLSGSRDRSIPFNEVEIVGERVILKRKTFTEDTRDDRFYNKEEADERYVETRDLSRRSDERDKPIIRDEER